MLRKAIFMMLMILSSQLKAQTFRARVIDLVTKQPISGATVKWSASTLTDANGNFSITNARIGDTLRIMHLGYKPYIFTFNALHPGLSQGIPPDIALEPKSILLKEVFVKSFRSSKADSIKNREAFAAEFAYKSAGFKDIFVMKSPEESMARHVDVHRGNNPYSASSLIKLDVLSIVGLLSKNKSAPSKLQKALTLDESNKYIDQAFSKERIIAITQLSGDSLNKFMNQYRPTLGLTRSMTEYEMIEYIRRGYSEFIK